MSKLTKQIEKIIDCYKSGVYENRGDWGNMIEYQLKPALAAAVVVERELQKHITVATFALGFVDLNPKHPLYQGIRRDLRESLEALKDSNPKQEKCWLCSGSDPDTTINVACDVPNGKHTKPHDVRVHHSCYMDIEP